MPVEINLKYDGSLFWKRTVPPYFVEIPLDILSSEQKELLKKYLENDNLTFQTKDRSSLLWEYWYRPDDQILVTCVELSKEQKNQLVHPKPIDKNRKNFSNTNFLEILSELNNGIITWQEARDLVTSVKGKPWETKEWKVKRDLKIKDSCAQCGGKEQLLLQHIKQPRKFDTVLKFLKREHREGINEWIEKEQFNIDLTGIEKTAPCCPKCNSQTIRFRKTLNIWVCIAVDKGVRCGYRFETPKKDIPRNIVREKTEIEKQKRINEYIEKSGIGKQAMQISLVEMVEYLSLENNVITLCNKCAFAADYFRIQFHKRKG